MPVERKAWIVPGKPVPDGIVVAFARTFVMRMTRVLPAGRVSLACRIVTVGHTIEFNYVVSLPWNTLMSETGAGPPAEPGSSSSSNASLPFAAPAVLV